MSDMSFNSWQALIVLLIMVQGILQAVESQTCAPYHHKCLGTENDCILVNWLCDGELDCPLGDDEKNCPAECLPPLHRCRGDTFQCIPPTWFCDKDSDCPQGEDEENCEVVPVISCGFGRQLCRGTSHTCISLPWLCDGVEDCPEGDDEENCYESVTDISTMRDYPEPERINLPSVLQAVMPKSGQRRSTEMILHESTTTWSIPKTTISTSESTVEPTADPMTIFTSKSIIEPTSDLTTIFTSESTTEPTSDPTTVFTSESTAEPTSDSTTVFTSESTAEPTSDSTTVFTSESTAEPTSDPTTVFTSESTAEPTSDTTTVFTSESTAEPTSDPTTVFRSESTAEPTSDSTILFTSESTADPRSDSTTVFTSESTAQPTSDPATTFTSESTIEPISDRTTVFTSQSKAEPASNPTTVFTSESTDKATSESKREPTLKSASEPISEFTSELISESTNESTSESTSVPTPESTSEPTPESKSEPAPESTNEPTPESTSEPTPESTSKPTPESTSEPTPESTSEPKSESTSEPTPESTSELTPESTSELTPESTSKPTPESTSEPKSESTSGPVLITVARIITETTLTNEPAMTTLSQVTTDAPGPQPSSMTTSSFMSSAPSMTTTSHDPRTSTAQTGMSVTKRLRTVTRRYVRTLSADGSQASTTASVTYTPGVSLCSKDHYQCRGLPSICLTRERLCDGKLDCAEGDDEENCQGSNAIIKCSKEEEKRGYFRGKSVVCNCSSDVSGGPGGHPKWAVVEGSRYVQIQGESIEIEYDPKYPERLYTCGSPGNHPQRKSADVRAKFAFFEPESVTVTPSVINRCGNDGSRGSSSNSSNNINSSSHGYADKSTYVTCQVSKVKVNPAPLFSFSFNGAGFDSLAVGEESDAHYLRRLEIRSKHVGRYSIKCRVSNRILTDLQQEVVKTVLIQEPPKLPPVLTVRGKSFQGISKADLTVTPADLSDPHDVTCTVRRGYPAAKVTYHGCGWQYASPSRKGNIDNSNGSTASTNGFPRFVCSCRAEHVTGCYGNSETSVTLKFKSFEPDEKRPELVKTSEPRKPSTAISSNSTTQSPDTSNRTSRGRDSNLRTNFYEKGLYFILLIGVSAMALLVIIVLVSVIIEVAKKKRKNAYDVNSNNGHQKIIFTELSSL